MRGGDSCIYYACACIYVDFTFNRYQACFCTVVLSFGSVHCASLLRFLVFWFRYRIEDISDKGKTCPPLDSFWDIGVNRFFCNFLYRCLSSFSSDGRNLTPPPKRRAIARLSFLHSTNQPAGVAETNVGVGVPDDPRSTANETYIRLTRKNRRR